MTDRRLTVYTDAGLLLYHFRCYGFTRRGLASIVFLKLWTGAPLKTSGRTSSCCWKPQLPSWKRFKCMKQWKHRLRSLLCVEHGAFMCRHSAVSWWGGRQSTALWAAFNNRSMLHAAESASEGGVQSTNRRSNEAFRAALDILLLVVRAEGFPHTPTPTEQLSEWGWQSHITVGLPNRQVGQEPVSRHGNRKPG